MITWNVRFRDGFYVGLGLAIVIGCYLVWLWQPERQIDRHTRNLFHEIETKDWPEVERQVAPDYADQWNQDRSLVLLRLRSILGYVRGGRVLGVDPSITTANGNGLWRAKVIVEGDGEYLDVIKQRVNSLASPFELEWRKASAKPWDWQLLHTRNPDLDIPADFE